MLRNKSVGDLAYHSKNLKDVALMFTLLNATKLNSDHEMTFLYFG